jgi:phage shock protein C
MNQKLTRSRSERILGGVCGGLARWIGIDPIFIRLFFVVLAAAGGSGVGVYILLWIIIPEEGMADSVSIGDRARDMGGDMQTAFSKPNPKMFQYLGIGLIVLGGIIFLDRLNLPWLGWFNDNLVWALLIIVAGVALLVRALRGGDEK